MICNNNNNNNNNNRNNNNRNKLRDISFLINRRKRHTLS
jgi:hypothetical protein